MTFYTVGLCAGCRHGHWIVSGRGSRFLRCQKSLTDSAYPRFPQLPVLTCDGFEPGGPADANDAGDLPPDTRP